MLFKTLAVEALFVPNFLTIKLFQIKFGHFYFGKVDITPILTF